MSDTKSYKSTYKVALEARLKKQGLNSNAGK